MKQFIVSILFGITLAIAGKYLISYAAGIAIPTSVFTWFDQHLSLKLGLLVINILTQFAGFGIIAIIIGNIIGSMNAGYKSSWLLHCVITYVTTLAALGFDGHQFSNPYADIDLASVPVVLVIPICLILSAYITTMRYNKRS